MAVVDTPGGGPARSSSCVRPEWLFTVVNRVQALATADAGTPFPPPEAGLDAQSELERELARTLLTRLQAEQTSWAARHAPAADAPPPSQTPVDDAVARAQRLLGAHYARRWTLEALAGRVGCNRTDLESGFRRQCSYTVHTYLVIRRVAAAQELLRTTAWRINEVGKAVGFRSKVTLYEHFRRVLRMTPDEYRRRWSPVPALDHVRALLAAASD